MDPHGSFLEFLKKDVCKNIDVYRDGLQKQKYQTAQPSRETSKRNSYLTQPIEDARLNTDHISFEPPRNERPFQHVFDKMMTAPSHTANIETSKKSWQPYNCNKTVNNKSSVAYDILSHNANGYSGVEMPSIIERKVANRKKGVTEFGDLTRVTALRMNVFHNEALEKNSTIFRKKTGEFTHMYDAAVRNGNISMPFKK